jgi:chromate transporter
MVGLISLFKTFSSLSVFAIGGSNSLLPTLQNSIVNQHHWLTPQQFRDIYNISQIAPGPNMLCVVLIGFYLKGILGAITVMLAFFVPDCLLVFYAHHLWQHFSATTWFMAIRKGLEPIVIGLMFAGVFMLAQMSIFDCRTALIAFSASIILYKFRINPIYMILGGGLLGLMSLA